MTAVYGMRPLSLFALVSLVEVSAGETPARVLERCRI